MRWKGPSHEGFSLVELMVVVGLFTIVAAIAVPTLGVGERVRVNNAASQVRHTLQTARLRAVATNRPLQVRLNCPSDGSFRIVEADWAEAGRCDPTTYPYPAPVDAAYRIPALPRYDGPVQFVNSRVDLSAAEPDLVVQFFPDGRAMKVVGGATQLIATVAITVSSDGYQRTISVNSLGKVLAE